MRHIRKINKSSHNCVRVSVCCSVLQRVVVCCSVLQCVAVCCSVLQWMRHIRQRNTSSHNYERGNCVCVLQCVAVCCSLCVCVVVCAHCLHVCLYGCMHACMYVRMYVYTYVCMYVCMYACMHVCMYVHTHKHMRHAPVKVECAGNLTRGQNTCWQLWNHPFSKISRAHVVLMILPYRGQCIFDTCRYVYIHTRIEYTYPYWIHIHVLNTCEVTWSMQMWGCIEYT